MALLIYKYYSLVGVTLYPVVGVITNQFIGEYYPLVVVTLYPVVGVITNQFTGG